jgi:hypothetical protein
MKEPCVRLLSSRAPVRNTNVASISAKVGL